MSRTSARHEDETRIRSVLESYCALLDAGDADELTKLFTDECSFAMMGRNYQGRAELAAVWSRVTKTDRPATLHALMNPMIRIDGDSATAISGWAMIDRSGDDGGTVIAMAGRYYDTLERGADARWRFASRRVQTLARPAAQTTVSFGSSEALAGELDVSRPPMTPSP